MSREIKFRGLTKPTRESPSKWVYGYYSFDGANYWITDPKTVERAWIVLPETVGQFTGLKDKNGKDVDWWVNDILKQSPTGRIGIVKYQPEFAQYIIESSQGVHWCSLAAAYHDGWKKIGNIHENPELKASPGNQEDMD